MRIRKTIFDDGFQAYLTEGATVVGDPGIPMLMKLDNGVYDLDGFNDYIDNEQGN